MAEIAMTAQEISDTFRISKVEVIRICKTKGSPAYKSGLGKTGGWLCMPSKFEKFMLDNAERWKG